jgi:hypothetical protein
LKTAGWEIKGKKIEEMNQTTKELSGDKYEIKTW